MIGRVVRFWLKAEAIQLAFAIGTGFGMIVEAILMVFVHSIPPTAGLLAAVVHHFI